MMHPAEFDAGSLPHVAFPHLIVWHTPDIQDFGQHSGESYIATLGETKCGNLLGCT